MLQFNLNDFSLQHIRFRRVLRGGGKHVLLLDNPGRPPRRGDRRAQAAQRQQRRHRRSRRQGLRRVGLERTLFAKDVG